MRGFIVSQMHLSPTTYGVDFEAASARGQKVIWALSLPAKCAPKTAGCIVGETVCRCLAETGGVQNA